MDGRHQGDALRVARIVRGSEVECLRLRLNACQQELEQAQGEASRAARCLREHAEAERAAARLWLDLPSRRARGEWLTCVAAYSGRLRRQRARLERALVSSVERLQLLRTQLEAIRADLALAVGAQHALDRRLERRRAEQQVRRERHGELEREEAYDLRQRPDWTETS